MRVLFSLQKWLAAHWGRPLREWPLGLWMALLLLPLSLGGAGLCLLFGFHVSYPAYATLAREKGQMEAAVLTGRLEAMLAEFRDGMLLLAAHAASSEEILQRAQDIFKNHIEIIDEIALRKRNGSSTVWLREANGYRVIDERDFVSNPYSVLQQADAVPLKPGEALLLPAVTAHYPSSPERNRANRLPVMRLATPLPGQSGILVLGISLNRLRADMTSFMPRAGLEARLAYFFSNDGWMLFEMTGGLERPDDPLVDIARRGYTGDLGKSGLDMTFRPWAEHQNYWGMIKAVQAEQSGLMEMASGSVSREHKTFSMTFSFAPVMFSPGSGVLATPVGGLALSNAVSGHGNMFRELGGVSLKLFFIIILFVLVLSRIAHRRIGVPLDILAEQSREMQTAQNYALLEQPASFREHQMLLSAMNGLLVQLASQRSTLLRLEREVEQSRALQPVDLHQAGLGVSQQILADHGIVGSSRHIALVREEIQRAAKVSADVLVWGETGTGKELVAEAIHQCSLRKDGQLVSINCGALDEHLLLDALFGHTKGAFTEARTERKGAFLSAEGGTLHLDEIGNASLKVQQALLRALSVRRIRPLGSDVEIPFDTRVIAATNADLLNCVREGTFREDLFYRISIISIRTPSLRRRKEDIPELAAFCLHRYGEKMGKRGLRISRGALEALTVHDWPGNVREFINCMIRAIAFADASLILPEHIIFSDTDDEPNPAQGLRQEKDAGQPFLAGDAPGRAGDLVLNGRQERIRQFLLTRESVTRAEVEALLGQDVSIRSIQLDLRAMTQAGLIEKVGAGPGTRYVLARQNRD